jgi:hypothetical protein
MRLSLAAIHARSSSQRTNPASRSSPPNELLRQQNIARTADFLRQAGQLGADLAATHECCDTVNLESLASDRALCLALVETIPGPTSDLLGSIARQYAMNIAANYHERQGDTIYNTSVLIDRWTDHRHLPQGAPAAPRKMVCAAGDAFSVLGVRHRPDRLCDLLRHCLHGALRALALNGADIIVHQTMGWGWRSTKSRIPAARPRGRQPSLFARREEHPVRQRRLWQELRDRQPGNGFWPQPGARRKPWSARS